MANNNRGFIANTLYAMEDNLLAVMMSAAILSGVGVWTYKIYSAYKDAKVQTEKIRAGLELKVGDYNHNQILDKFYEISSKKVPVEVDGKPIEEYFKK